MDAIPVNTSSRLLPEMKSRQFDHQILLLQGGGALGAYHGGVYEGLTETGREPSWVVGVSIGSITSALIAGNPPEKRVQSLRAFWDRVSDYAPSALPMWLSEPMRPVLNYLSAATVATYGSPGFFKPRMPPPFFFANGGPEATSLYDTSPLKHTLEKLVDFDLLNNGKMRVSLGATNVRTGASVYFDNKTTRIGPEHVMASGALPPGFPAVEINGEHYWDGGIVSNSPLHYVWDERPLTTALILQVDLFKPTGELPRNLFEVLERQKDVQYSSKQRFNIERAMEFGKLRASLCSLLKKLPADLKVDPDAHALTEAFCDERDWIIGRLINQRLPHVSQNKDYEFSRATVRDHWAAGLEDIRRSVANLNSIIPTDIGSGIRVYDLPGFEPLSQ
jgi:NTE family protein